MSFSLTTEQVRDRSKTVTRRLGWWDLQPGTILQAVEKAQGLKKDEHVKPICLIRVTSSRDERLDSIERLGSMFGPIETAREGFPDLTPEQFVSMFIEHNKRDGVYPDTIVNRIEFEYLP
jgi:hypothetical protein